MKKNEFLLYKMNSYCLLCIWYDLEKQSHALLKVNTANFINMLLM